MTRVEIIQYFTGGFFIFYLVLYSTLLHWPAPDSTVSEDAEIEPRTGATLVLTVRRSNHSARYHACVPLKSSFLGPALKTKE